jgi:hypothetical protein
VWLDGILERLEACALKYRRIMRRRNERKKDGNEHEDQNKKNYKKGKKR